ncbi:MAG TPA: AAA family ATPase, partial [Steroidobacteraceae bacterium]|nr:AAA family ATPase [Steroidobacteraceae bacterium]
LPRIDERLFVQIFQQLMGVPPPADWDAGGGDWVRYLLHADFHAPLRLKLSAVEAVDYLRERSQARLAQVSPTDSLRLDQLHGLGEARQVAEDLVADIAAARAERIPWSAVDRGLLLVGAPGTGKTTLARAIAQACGIKFVHVSASQWQAAGGLDLHLRAIRSTFNEARRYAPAILFIDEIDSIGNRELFSGSNAIYQTEVVNALLEQLQGMDEDEPLIVIGATNYLGNVDPALRRAGRLDQVVTLPRPNVAGLEHIFSFHLAPHRSAGRVARDVRIKVLAQLAFGLTGADVEFFVRGAARRARKARRRITQADLVAEITRRPRRPDSVVSLTPDDMRRVAIHEAGHAISALMSANGASEITYVSIIPRMDGSLGFTATAPAEGAVMTRTEVQERLRTILAGRAAEEVIFGKEDVSLSAGGGDGSDLAVATRVATRVICTSGFSGDHSLLWTSSPTAAQLEQVEGLLRVCYRAAIDLLRDQRAALDRIVQGLVERQELDGAAVRSLLDGRSAAAN